MSCRLSFQRLKSSLSERQQQLYKLLDDEKRLLLHVSCSELETQLNQLGDHWLSTTTKINKELQRLDSTLKHWIRSEHLLTAWAGYPHKDYIYTSLHLLYNTSL